VGSGGNSYNNTLAETTNVVEGEMHAMRLIKRDIH
jgi:hypothetical protein